MLEVLNTLLWGPGTLALILGTGAWLTLRTGGFPQRNLGWALALSLGREARRKGRGGVSPFGSLMTALASTVGTGNIVGVAAALVSGGPGGACVDGAGGVAGTGVQVCRMYAGGEIPPCPPGRHPLGRAHGGDGSPAGRSGQMDGEAVCRIRPVDGLHHGALAQSGALADTFSAAFTLPRWRVGLVTAALALTILLGGIRRIADISTVLVPVMALLYLGGGLAVILGNLRRLPEAVTLMLRCAVAPEAALGGALGIVTRREALRWGVARSVFSNEAGLGSAAITAACADTEDPVKQGLISMTGVFFDTMVICTVTGLAICCSGTLGTADGAGRPLTGAALTLRAFETVLGPLAPWLIGVALGLFAFTSVLGCAVQAETTASYLLGPEAVRPCRVLYGLAVFAGAVIPMAAVLQLADLANALMAFPNLVCLLLLSDEIAGECGRKDR